MAGGWCSRPTVARSPRVMPRRSCSGMRPADRRPGSRRAATVLERVAARPAGDKQEHTREARRLLERLAAGEPGAPLTQAARSALKRGERPDPAKEPAVGVAEQDSPAELAPPPAKLLKQ